MWAHQQSLSHVFVCCGSSLTGNLPSAVWPAGLVACVCVLRLLPDRRPAECSLARCECFTNLMLILLALPSVPLPVVSDTIHFWNQVKDWKGYENLTGTQKQRFVIYANLYHKVHLSTVYMLPSTSSSALPSTGVLRRQKNERKYGC